MTEGWSYYLDFKNQMFELEEGERTVGRSRTCDISVNDPSVSRRHVVLKAGSGKILLKDLGSSNGTFINGERVQETGELHHGDTLGLGDADLNVRVIGTSAFQTVRMQAHPLEEQHGEATLFLQKASEDLAQEAIEMDFDAGPGHMAPPAPGQLTTPAEPAQTQPPSAAGFAAPPTPQPPPPQTSPEPVSPWAAPATPAASEPALAPSPTIQSTQEVTAEGVRFSGAPGPAPASPAPPAQPAPTQQGMPAQPGPPAHSVEAQQAAPPQAAQRPTLPTASAATPQATAAQPSPPRPAAVVPPAPQTPASEPVSSAPPMTVPQAPAPTPQAPTPQAHSGPAQEPAPPPPAAPPQAAASPTATPQAPESAQTDQAAADLLPSLDGFDVTMGPEMLAAMPVREEKTEETPAYNPYSAPSPQGKAAGAGFGIRLLAVLVDDLWIAAIWAGLFFSGLDNMVASSAASGIAFLVVLFGWAIWGTTPGKRVFNLFVTTGGQAAGIGFPRALARLVGYVASALPLCIGFLMIAFNKEKRGLHDIIAGTTVSRQ